MHALMVIRRAATWTDCRPPSDRERLAAFRGALHQRHDFEPLAHAAQIARGVAWLAEFQRRPIPRHRALVPVARP